MAELIDIVSTASNEADRSLDAKAAVVLSVSGNVATVDMGGPITVRCVATCVPRVGQSVIVGAVGTTRWAFGVLDEVYKQDLITVTGSDSTTVTGLLNGASTAIPKVGAFTVSNGTVLVLLWTSSGRGPYAIAPPGVPYVPDPSGGGGGGAPPPSGGGGGGTYTSSYAATGSGYFRFGYSTPGDVNLSATSSYGYFTFGTGRMRELAGKTIQSGRIYLPRLSGSGSVALKVSGNPGSTSTATGGWGTLSSTRLAELVAQSGLVDVRLTGSGILKGTPAGTIQITWS